MAIGHTSGNKSLEHHAVKGCRNHVAMSCSQTTNLLRMRFSAYQQVIGVLPRAASDLLADHDPPVDIASVPGQGDFHRAQVVRASALKAFVSHSVRSRVRRAEASATKAQDRFEVGEVVYILRKGAYNKYYRLGPGII
eukprot:6194512-Amphidinium_carterae.1